MINLFSNEAMLKDAQSREYFENTRWAFLGRQRESPGTKRIGIGGNPKPGQEKYGVEIWEFSPDWHEKAHAFARWAQTEYIKSAEAHNQCRIDSGA
jgi:hypothetical protein